MPYCCRMAENCSVFETFYNWSHNPKFLAILQNRIIIIISPHTNATTHLPRLPIAFALQPKWYEPCMWEKTHLKSVLRCTNLIRHALNISNHKWLSWPVLAMVHLWWRPSLRAAPCNTSIARCHDMQSFLASWMAESQNSMNWHFRKGGLMA